MKTPQRSPGILLGRRVLDGAVWGCLLLVLLAWQVMQWTGDLWWGGTFLLFSPRILLIIPFCVLLPFVLWKRRWLLLLPLAAGMVVVCIPFMGFTYALMSHNLSLNNKPIRVVTCNIHSGDFDQMKLALLIRHTAADIVMLQECPAKAVYTAPLNWSIVSSKDFAILSRYPLEGLHVVSTSPPGESWKIVQLLQSVAKTPYGDVAVCSVQLPTPRYGLQEMFDRKTIVRLSRKGRLEKELRYRREAAEKVRDYVERLTVPVIIGGDFNTPEESRLFKAVWGDYRNAFSETGRGYGWTQRVRFSGIRFRARIDHILTKGDIVPLTSAVGVDVDSDHLPLIADVVVTKAGGGGKR